MNCSLNVNLYCVRVCVSDGFTEIRHCRGRPSSEADHRRRLPSLPCRAVICQTRTFG